MSMVAKESAWGYFQVSFFTLFFCYPMAVKEQYESKEMPIDCLEFGAANLLKAREKRQCLVILLHTFTEWQALK